MLVQNGKPAEQATAIRTRSQPRLRVLILSALPRTGAGLEVLLRGAPGLDVIVSAPTDEARAEIAVRETDADILLIDLEESEPANSLAMIRQLSANVPVIGFFDHPSPIQLHGFLQAGIHALLPVGVTRNELTAAIQAVAGGLVVLAKEFAQVLSEGLPEVSDEEEPLIESLTPREQQVLAMVAAGLANKEIADRLQISEHTVKFHISSIMGKLGASNRTEAVTRGIRRGIVLV